VTGRARGSDTLGVGKFLLGIHELFLHLLSGGEQLLHIQLAVRVHFCPVGVVSVCGRVGPGGCLPGQRVAGRAGLRPHG